MKNKKVQYIIIALAVIAASAIVYFIVDSLLEGSDSDIDEGVQVSRRFNVLEEPVKAADIVFEDMEGNRFALADFKGRHVIINFWAIFCGPCVEELPDFDRAVGELDSRGIELVAINIVEPMDEVQGFISDMKLKNLDFYMDIDGNSANTYSISTIPRTLVINSDGFIVAAASGAVTYDDLMSVAGILD